MIKLAMENKSNKVGSEPLDIVILQFGNKQKIVRIGQSVEVDHIPNVEKGQIIFLPAFHVSTDQNLKEMKIKAEVIESTYLGEKIKIVKKRKRTGYRRTIGFRVKMTLVKIMEE
jgi:ribosomal protein L21